MLAPPVGRIQPELVNSFHAGDLRKNLFLTENSDGSFGFRGSYEGAIHLFSGLSLSEIYLTKAEAAVRNGRVAEGIAVLNELLETRWEEGSFVPYQAKGVEEALEIVLLERRKELVHR